jgi:hypothetical protein
MWHVVAAYAGESSYCMKLNWLFLGPAVMLWKLHHYFVKLSLCLTAYVLRRNKSRYMGMFYVKQIIKCFRDWDRKVEDVGSGRGYFKFRKKSVNL